jgi:hypothetical protein
MFKFFTYIYIDPRNRQPFYVGKGTSRRIKFHLLEAKAFIRGKTVSYTPKLQKIIDILNDGLDPEIRILFSTNIETEALRYEEKVIAFFGRKDLGDGSLLNRNDGGRGGRTIWSKNARKQKSIHSSSCSWIHNEIEEKFIQRQEIKLFLTNGFVKGRLPGVVDMTNRRSYIGDKNPAFGKNRHDLIARNELRKRWVTDGKNDHQILVEDLARWVVNGFFVGRSQIKKTELLTTCGYCSSVFTQKKPNQRFCCLSCVRLDQQNKYHNCEICHISFRPTKSRASRFCSRPCYNQSRVKLS